MSYKERILDMDWTQIIVALITVAGATIGTLLVNQREKRKDAADRLEREATKKAEQEAKEAAEKKAQSEQLEQFKNDIIKTLGEHRKEYLDGIDEVKDTIADIKSEYKTTVATVSLQIKNLEDKQDKHNSIIERTYKLESDVKLLDQREKVSEHRLNDLEGKHE